MCFFILCAFKKFMQAVRNFVRKMRFGDAFSHTFSQISATKCGVHLIARSGTYLCSKQTWSWSFSVIDRHAFHTWHRTHTHTLKKSWSFYVKCRKYYEGSSCITNPLCFLALILRKQTQTWEGEEGRGVGWCLQQSKTWDFFFFFFKPNVLMEACQNIKHTLPSKQKLHTDLLSLFWFPASSHIKRCS